jgi:hypothetical protein
MVEFTSRYDVLGAPLRPEFACRRCDATGLLPVREHEVDPELHGLWLRAQARTPTDDGWHLVTCPSCGGSRSKFGPGAAGMNQTTMER